jgi:hypothetical protein
MLTERTRGDVTIDPRCLDMSPVAVVVENRDLGPGIDDADDPRTRARLHGNRGILGDRPHAGIRDVIRMPDVLVVVAAGVARATVIDIGVKGHSIGVRPLRTAVRSRDHGVVAGGIPAE